MNAPLVEPDTTAESSMQRVCRTLSFVLFVLPLYVGLVLLMRLFELAIRFVPHGRSKFLPAEDFAWTADIRANWQNIRTELAAVLENLDDIPNFQDLQVEQRMLTNDNRWKTFVFWAYGVPATKNCQQCPATAATLQQIPGMKTAMFSILTGNKRIPPHRGPYKGVLRYHLGLIVPEESAECGIRVGDQTAHWEEGGDMVFDDSYEHEAWNNTDSIRVVLFVDFLRPLPAPLAAINRGIVWLISKTPFIQDARKRQEDWWERVSQRRERLQTVNA